MLRCTLEPLLTVDSNPSPSERCALVQEIGRVSRRCATRDRRPHLTNPSNIARRVFPRLAYRLPVLLFFFFSFFSYVSPSLSTLDRRSHGESSRELQATILCVSLPSVFLSLSSNCPSSFNVPGTRQTISVTHSWPSSQPAAGHTLPRAFFRPEWANGARVPDCRGSWSLH